MARLTRRAFIGTAAAGAAAATVTALPGVASAAPHDDDTDDREAPVTSGPVMVRVRDARTGAMSLYLGTEEISFTDKTLARRLVRAAARG
jgi:hypothetical protein